MSTETARVSSPGFTERYIRLEAERDSLIQELMEVQAEYARIVEDHRIHDASQELRIAALDRALFLAHGGQQ